MSRTKKGSKGPGYDYWSKRCFGNKNIGYGKVAKEITKQKENTRKKKEIRENLKDF